jgi:3',5'-cyclic AMP phosphodiesterase CpdA
VRSAEFGVRYKIGIVIISLILSLTSTVFATQDQQIQQKLAALEKIQGKFSFVVIGDNRSGIDTYKKIVSMIMERKPDFVVNTGDMITTPGSKQDWAKFWEMSKPITVPYFLTVGNHDAHPKVPLSEKTYKNEVDLPGNELYYSFVAGNSLFIILDSYLDDQEKKITGVQLKWLEEILAASRQKHKFVFLHHPLYTDLGKGHHAHDSIDKYPDSRDRLEALFAKSRVDAVFAGHEHYYERRTVDGIIHIITGGGGAPIYDKEEYGGFNHFVQVTVDGDKVSAEVVDISGKVRDRF